MAQIRVDHWNVDEDGPLTEGGMKKKLESKGYHVSRYVYSPGTFFDDHKHAVDKIDGVFSGRFEMAMYGEKVILEAGDCLTVPRGVVHNAKVIGDEPVISFDATKQ